MTLASLHNAGVRLRDKAILLLAHELQPRLDPTMVAARIEKTLHAAYHLRGHVAEEQAKRGADALVSRSYAETMQDRWTRLQSETGCLIRSQLLDGAPYRHWERLLSVEVLRIRPSRAIIRGVQRYQDVISNGRLRIAPTVEGESEGWCPLMLVLYICTVCTPRFVLGVASETPVQHPARPLRQTACAEV